MFLWDWFTNVLGFLGYLTKKKLFSHTKRLFNSFERFI